MEELIVCTEEEGEEDREVVAGVREGRVFVGMILFALLLLDDVEDDNVDGC